MISILMLLTGLLLISANSVPAVNEAGEKANTGTEKGYFRKQTGLEDLECYPG